MILSQVQEIISGILYLDNKDQVNPDDSLDDIGLSSIDFIDFCFEVKSKINNRIEPDDIWPVSKMVNDDQLYINGQWTQLGRQELSKLFKKDVFSDASYLGLRKLFTPRFCSSQIERLANA